ncbi:unnamed protein product [Gongylonema pulchrum]|uniref:C2H2-type domain-containing protein n=1 Tax=Gongylonema pulchrum TaxID=637853 RepID=A0A183EAX9_9BILA|nr:unnamed protein product [Gongylonema pulchrum]
MPPPANNGESNSTPSSNPYRRSGRGHGFKKFDNLDLPGGLEETSVHRQLKQFAEEQPIGEHETSDLTLPSDNGESDSGHFSNSQQKLGLDGVGATYLLNNYNETFIHRQFEQFIREWLTEQDEISISDLLMNSGLANSCLTPFPRWRPGGGCGDKQLDFMDLQTELENPCIYRQLEQIVRGWLPEQDEVSNPSSSFDSKGSSHYFGMSLRPGCVQDSRSSSDCEQDWSRQSDSDPSLSLLTDCDQGQNFPVNCSQTSGIRSDYGQSLSLNWSSSAKQTTVELDDTDSVVAAERMPISRQLEHFTVGWLAETPNPILSSDAKSNVQQNLCSGTKADADQGIMKFDLTDMAFGSDTTFVTARTAVSFTSFDFCPNYWDLRGSKSRKILRTGPGSVFDQLTEQQPPATMKGVHPISNQFEAAASHTVALTQHIKLFQSCATELHETDHVKLPRSDFPARNFASFFSTQTGSRSVPDSPRNSGGDEYGLGAFFSRTSADDESGSDLFSSQIFARDNEAGASAQQNLIVDRIASNLLLGGPSGCNFQSKLPEDKVPGKLGSELLNSPGLEHVEICRADLTGSQRFQTQNSPASRLVSPPTTFSGNFTVDASQFPDKVGDSDSTSTSSEATRFKGFTCGVCSQELKFKLFGCFRKHLNSHNKRGEYRCNWLHCGTTFDNRHILERHYLDHLLEYDLHRCAECGRIFDSAPFLNAHTNAVHLVKKSQFCLRKSKAFYISIAR